MKFSKAIASLMLGALLLPSLAACQNSAPEVTEMNDTTAEIITDAPTEPATEPTTEPVTEEPARVLTVVCVGDSITEGVGSSNKATHSYPAQLQSLLGDGYKVINCGKSKATAQNASSKYHNTNGIPYRTTEQYGTALNSLPDIVLIMLGTNDAKHVTGSISESVDEYYNALKAIAEKFVELESKPKVYIVLSPYRYEDSARKANMDSAIIPTQKKLASDMGLDIIDLFTVTKNALKTKNIYSDKLHFNDDGYAVIAEAIKNAITK